ncbi:MAG: amino acid permease [Myxococcales bacterium]|nr:amino acid permease [Myxococcales bacterium]
MSNLPLQPPTEHRVVGTLGAFAIVTGSMLGIGIFLTPYEVAQMLHTPGLFLLAWFLGGLIALAGAVAYAELGTMFPRAGGDYVFLRESFGKSVSFACGWVLFAGVFTGSIATLAVAVCQYQLPTLLAPVGAPDLTPQLTIGGLTLPVTGTQLAAIALVTVFTVINVLGARVSALVQVLVTVIPLALFALASIVILVSGQHPEAIPSPRAADLTTGPWYVAMTQATLAIYFAYSGWNAIGYVGGEVANPSRNIPLALVGGTVLVTVLYVVMCAGFVAALGMGGIEQSFEVGTAIANAYGGTAATLVVTGLIAMALVGSLNGTILGGARIAMAMAHDGAIARNLGSVSRRTGTPARALVMQTLLAGILIVSGTFDQLYALTSIAMLLIGGLTVVSLFLLRARRPDAERPYRAMLYPWLPGFYVATCVSVIGIKVVGVLTPEEGTRLALSDLLPLLGLGIFAAAWLGHRLLIANRQTISPA